MGTNLNAYLMAQNGFLPCSMLDVVGAKLLSRHGAVSFYDIVQHGRPSSWKVQEWVLVNHNKQTTNSWFEYDNFIIIVIIIIIILQIFTLDIIFCYFAFFKRLSPEYQNTLPFNGG